MCKFFLLKPLPLPKIKLCECKEYLPTMQCRPPLLLIMLMVTISMGVKEHTVQVPSPVKVDGCQKGQHKQFVVALERQLYKVLTEVSDGGIRKTAIQSIY